MHSSRPPWLAPILFASALAIANLHAAAPSATTASTNALPLPSPGKASAASEDSAIPNFHSLGNIEGRGPVYRSVGPVDKIADGMKTDEPTAEQLQQAIQQMKHLRDLGVRSIISLQIQEPSSDKKINPEYRAVVLEMAAAKAAGLKYVGFSMSNHGKNSLQDMDTAAVSKVVQSVSDEILSDARDGGVVFHCKSGKDRTGLIAAYLRVKYQHWTLPDAIAEMRGYGHVWQKFTRPGMSNSWHEAHLQAIVAQDAQ